MKVKALIELGKNAASEWSDDNVSRLSAALAYYTVFSIAPLLVIILGIVSLVLGQEAARGRAMEQLGSILGPQGTAMLQGIAEHGAQAPGSGLIATVISVIVLLFTVSGVFYELQTSLDTVWDVAPKSGGLVDTLKRRLPSFSIIPVVGFLLIVSLVASTGVSAFGHFLGDAFPGISFLLQGINFLLSFVVVGLLFALIYKILPDVKIRWSDVWLGAGVTALLFSIGKLGIGLYLGKSSIASTYGAAGSLVVLLAWVYYSSQIFFFGAEFTQVYANRYGTRIVPTPEAEPVRGERPEAKTTPSRPREGREAPATASRGREAGQPAAEGGSPRGEWTPEARQPGSAAGVAVCAPAGPGSGRKEARHPWTIALAGFLGGIYAGLLLTRPPKAA